MLKLGYKLMSEEHGPTDLVKNAQLPEKAGFDFAAISVHFFPRLDEQGPILHWRGPCWERSRRQPITWAS
jgi:alkanesulfonate monooxygenase SsuD/methylene tetrahydromethanopterin reductase-like flavin-dependent oxidoreductase (luciferase family)